MNYMYDFRQAHLDRLEDAGVIKYGEHAHWTPKQEKTTLRSRILRQVRQTVSNRIS